MASLKFAAPASFSKGQRKSTLIAIAVAAMAATGLALSRPGAEEARVIPPPAVDESNGAPNEVAVLAGGCFWGVQGVFQHVAGVSNAVSGYAGGDKVSAKYMVVGSGMTGHAEAVQVSFDPR